MYRPRRSKNIQEAGAYISSPVTSSAMSDVSLSTLAYIMSAAKITSIEAMTTLTKEQIESMAAAIDSQIEADEKTISDNRKRIGELTEEITGQGGLQAQYNEAFNEYSTKLEEYERISSLIIQDKAQLINDRSTLTSLYSISTGYTSTLKSYQQLYESVVARLKELESTVNIYEAYYQNDLMNISTNTILYNNSKFNMSTIYSLSLNDYSEMMKAGVDPSNASTFSTSYTNNMGNYYTFSTHAAGYNSEIIRFKSSLLENYKVLSSILSISSFVMNDTNSYREMIENYEKLEDDNELKIKQYITDISGYINQISDINGQNSVLASKRDADVGAVGSAGANFYAYLQNALEAECDELTYAIQQYNAQIGFIVASLGIAMNKNSVDIDNYILRIINTTPNSASWISLSKSRDDLITANGSINTIILILNVLDTPFNNILNIITTEKSLKVEFIQQRRNIFNNYEVPALSSTEEQVNAFKTEYLDKFVTLNLKVAEINTQITNRKTILDEIKLTINSHKATINNFFAVHLNVTYDQLPDNLILVQDDNGKPLGDESMRLEPTSPNSNSIYALLPPIKFN